jgi:hypothetical protein
MIDCVQSVLFLTAKCRYTLQYTYPFAYYIQPSPRKELVSFFITYFKSILPYKKLSDTIAAANTCGYRIINGTYYGIISIGTYSLAYRDSVTRFFASGSFFSWISFLPAPEYYIKIVSIFFRKFTKIFAAQGLPPVSTTSVANGKNLHSEKFYLFGHLWVVEET